MRLTVGLALSMFLAGNAPPAEAVEAGEWQAAGQVAVLSLATAPGLRPGPGMGVELLYGLDDAFAARVAADVGLSHGAGGWTPHAGANLGVVYTIDVTRLLPWAELGGAVLWGPDDHSATASSAGLSAGLGAEYLLGPRTGLGLVARVAFLPLRLDRSPTGQDGITLFSLGARVSRTF